ncbi:MAG: M48 family metalloprotease, partial [Deltaproteobacteria bacterium]
MKIANGNLYKLIVSFMVPLFLFSQPYLAEPKAFAMSTEEERILGQKFVIQIRQSFDFVDDDFVDQYINDLGHYLIRPLETKHFPFHFYTVKDNDLNAFAGPGGHIFIFSGLINVMDEVDELAAVISHEIAHVSARHLLSRIEKGKKIGIATLVGMLVGILVGGDAGGAIVAGSTAAGMQAQLHYSREDERQADQLGFRYTDAAGFDPSGLIEALKEIQKGQWLGTDRIPPYLLTHPTGPERMSNLDIMLSDYAKKSENRKTEKFRTLYPFFKTIVRAKSVEPREAERVFNEELEKDPDSKLAHFGLGMVCKERSEYDLAIDHFQKALKGQPESVPVLRNLGEAFQLKGQEAKAITVLEKSLKIDDQDRSALFLLAMSYQNLEEYQKAIRLYERLTSMNLVKDEVFYNLGLSYGREGEFAHAHYNFGIYYKRLGRREVAKFHFQKAADLSKNDPALQGR